MAMETLRALLHDGNMTCRGHHLVVDLVVKLSIAGGLFENLEGKCEREN